MCSSATLSRAFGATRRAEDCLTRRFWYHRYDSKLPASCVRIYSTNYEVPVLSSSFQSHGVLSYFDFHKHRFLQPQKIPKKSLEVLLHQRISHNTSTAFVSRINVAIPLGDRTPFLGCETREKILYTDSMVLATGFSSFFFDFSR